MIFLTILSQFHMVLFLTGELKLFYMTKERYEDAITLNKLISAEESLYKAIKGSSGYVNGINVIIPNDIKLKSQLLEIITTRIAELKEQFAAI